MDEAGDEETSTGPLMEQMLQNDKSQTKGDCVAQSDVEGREIFLPPLFLSFQAEVPIRPGGAEGAGGPAAVLQDGAQWICPAPLLQRLSLQAVFCHTRLLSPSKTGVCHLL